MARKRELTQFRESLQKRRRELLAAIEATRMELRALQDQERDPEHEESAQSDSADFTLWQVAENQRRELTLVDAALARLDLGDYGTCVDCGLDIAMDRLKVIPFALRCEEDARRRELELRGASVPPSL